MSKLLVWYDGACPLCRHEIAFMRRLDRRNAIDFQDVTSSEGSCPLDRAELLSRFHALEDGHILSGAAAFAAMWRAIPSLRPFGIAARNPLILLSLEQLYKVFLRLRPRLQRFARWVEGQLA
jgi:predicted DCC family thiol-disulfide oxidoreductase YuxK